MLLTTIYNPVLTAAGVNTTRAAALQLTYTLTHRPTDWHSLSESTTLSSNERQRRQTSGKRTVRVTGHSPEIHNTEA